MKEQSSLMDDSTVVEFRMRAVLHQVKLLNLRVWELEKKVGCFGLVEGRDGSVSTPPGKKDIVPSQTKLNNEEKK